jgi:preprotein translocase subunit SecG
LLRADVAQSFLSEFCLRSGDSSNRPANGALTNQNFHFTALALSSIFRALIMSSVINILLAINVLVSLLIILLVLMQRPKSEGLGAAFGGGMTENIFGAGTTNALQTITRYLGAIFFFLSITLSWLYIKQSSHKSNVQQRLMAPTVIPAPAATPGQDRKAETGDRKDAAATPAATPASAPATPPAAPAPKVPAKAGTPAPASAPSAAPAKSETPAPANKGN